MAKGENIFKRKDGRWEGRYIKGYDLTGKIKYGYCYGKTYKEAKDKVEKCKSALQSGRMDILAERKQRFSYYCDEWLKNGKSKFKKSTYIKYEAILEKYVKKKLGSCYPTAITTELLCLFTNELLEQEHLAPKTVKDILVLVHTILKYTQKRYPGFLQTVEVIYPREAKKEMRILTNEEQDYFVSYLLEDMDSCKFGILLALYTGIRIGELCALRWENISLEEKTIKIKNTMQRLKNLDSDQGTKTQIVIGTPKSDRSVRVIPLMESIAILGTKIRPNNIDTYVLTSTAKYMEPRTLQYRMQRYVKACDLDGVHFHTLRHTFATRCVEAGFEIKSLSDILGHSTTTVTLERYVHSSIELKRSNMNKLKTFSV